MLLISRQTFDKFCILRSIEAIEARHAALLHLDIEICKRSSYPLAGFDPGYRCKVAFRNIEKCEIISHYLCRRGSVGIDSHCNRRILANDIVGDIECPLDIKILLKRSVICLRHGCTAEVTHHLISEKVDKLRHLVSRPYPMVEELAVLVRMVPDDECTVAGLCLDGNLRVTHKFLCRCGDMGDAHGCRIDSIRVVACKNHDVILAVRNYDAVCEIGVNPVEFLCSEIIRR